MAEKKATKAAATTTKKAAAPKKETVKKVAAKKAELVINAENVGFKAGDVYIINNILIKFKFKYF